MHRELYLESNYNVIIVLIRAIVFDRTYYSKAPREYTECILWNMYNIRCLLLCKCENLFYSYFIYIPNFYRTINTKWHLFYRSDGILDKYSWRHWIGYIV